MPELTDREKLEEIKERVDFVEKGYAETEWAESIIIKDLRWVIALASAFLSLKEKLENGKLLADYISYGIANYKDAQELNPSNFADWLLTHIQKEVK